MRQVLVVRTDKLPAIIGNLQGFVPLSDPAIIDRLAREAHMIEKEQAEKNTDFKQLIPYTVILNPDKRVYTYQRSIKEKDYEEKRLRGKVSLGVGGHIENDESIPDNIRRELQEEVKGVDRDLMIQKEKLELFGIINDDSDSVGQVHLGIVFILHTGCKVIRSRSGEALWGMFLDAGDVGIIIQKEPFENWSRLIFSHLLEFLSAS
ncbi:MAG: NUDIX domain-containing protein [Candidatus Moranbacteria bacterium]|nr:NUDIX domain-containing protein [Candidatus Moranbacteria bacterium]